MIFDSSTAAIVTGGASGLGQATARALAAAGIKVAIFDVNATTGQSVADEIGGVFCDVDITSEDSVVAGFTKARAAHGQERILVHCAMTSRRGKTLAYDKEAGRLKRLSTEDYIYGVNGILVASYRIASLAAEGMAALDPLEDGERGRLTLGAGDALAAAHLGAPGRKGVRLAGDIGDLLPRVDDPWLALDGAEVDEQVARQAGDIVARGPDEVGVLDEDGDPAEQTGQDLLAHVEDVEVDGQWRLALGVADAAG